MKKDQKVAERGHEQATVTPNFASEPMLFEIAYEVCQQLGGIYTVIRSKVPSMIQKWGNRYCLIGPFNPDVSPAEYEEGIPTGRIAEAIKIMRDRGINVKYGTWLVTGRPNVILLDPSIALANLDKVKYFYWKSHDIAMPANDWLLNQVMAFGSLVEEFFKILTGLPSLHRPVIAHFHEWMAATAIPNLRKLGVPISIVFTTHATLLGRFLAQNDPCFYDHLPFVDWLGDAKRMNLEPQVKIERACAHGAHVLTTVSEITAFECEHLLGRKPDLLLPNGLNIERFTAMHEFQNLHRLYKEKINRFVMAHFFPSYTFDLDHTLYFVSSGRYEYRNKGFDLTIDALAKLNERMKRNRIGRTIVFFLVTKRPYRSINSDVLQRRAVLDEIRSTCDSIKDQLGQSLFTATAMGQNPDYNQLVDDYWRLRLRRTMQAWKSRRLPLIVTHDLEDDVHDDVLNQLRAQGMINSPHDPVKVIYHPEFVSSCDPLFGMDYDQFVRGCHLGIFPSHYEPWGYTPLECLARGVPFITSDVSGFGTYLMQNMPDYGGKGMYVIHRRNKSFEDSSRELADWLYGFCRLERRDRISLRNRIESSSDHFDWPNLLTHYEQAYQLVRLATGR